ncbi:MAG: DNA primase [Clostridia bacterium]|nr:DNA primase [Clostridia bacterium]
MALFPEYIIREVSEKNDIYDVVSKYVRLKKSGNSYIGLCPFHNEKTPSFSVSPSRGVCHCFGCGEGGDVISFLMKVENISFYEAVKKLADMANITLPEISGHDREDARRAQERREGIYAINKEAALFFYEQLKTSRQSIDYLKKRQLSGAVVKSFWLGYAPDSWNSLFDYLKSKGYTESDIYNAGLIKKHESGRYYDMFRNRLMFPIFDASNNIIAFGGRVFDDSKPKYLNSPESAVFSKSRNLYGINVARNSKKNEVFLTEGYMDTIALIKSGFTNTVATLGTALTEQQAKMLSKIFKEIIICYDGDNAGCMARLRAITVLREHDIKISVIDMGASKDPDEFIKTNGVDRFKAVAAKRKNDMEYVLDYFGKDYDLKNPQSVVSYTDDVIEYLKLIRSSIEQDVYVNMLSSRTGVSANAIYSQLGISKAKQPKPAADVKGTDPLVLQLKSTAGKKHDILDKTREHLLSLIIFSKAVYNKNKDCITESLFEDEFHIRLLRFVKVCYEEAGSVTPAQITAHFDSEEDNPRAARILSLDNMSDDSAKAYEDYIKIIKSEIKKQSIHRLINSSETDDLSRINNLLKNEG